MKADTAPRTPNRLARERSPYLLQHAHNPVDWYPWGDEAFAAARASDRPIFLSIGYSTCHWCHVIERESFEDDEVAALLNEHFVCVKVDREERPDIDAVYMNVCQMMTGSGGWPLTILAAADKRPFFAATYIPRGSRSRRVGMLELVPRVGELWRTRRDELTRPGDRVVELLSRGSARSGGARLDAETLDLAQRRLAQRFDPELAGFGRAPKFPTPHNLGFLLRDAARTGRAESVQMVVETLDAMRQGGIWDHVGHGFHRYSTDRRWLVPHFEKMLYDQALLIDAYVEAHLLTGRPGYARTARQIFEYLQRDMTAPGGAFFSAEDADSEGVEGKFYLWTTDEVREVLGAEADLFVAAFGLTETGNFHDESTGEKTGLNIAHMSQPLADVAARAGARIEEVERRLEAARTALLARRSTRPRPSLDDKILADWNGLAVAALARASTALGDDEMLDAARHAARFVLDEMVDEHGGLLHSHRDGESAVPGFLDDYAFTVRALVELYHATFEIEHLDRALQLADEMVRRFWDESDGAFFLSGSSAELILARTKEAYDGAVPSGNSVAAVELLRLARLTGRADLEDRATSVLATFASEVGRAPEGFTHLLQALSHAVGPSCEVVIAGERDAPEAAAMTNALRRRFLPNVVVLRTTRDDATAVARLAPHAAAMAPVEGRAAAYVCRGHACELPTASAERMLELIGAPALTSTTP